MTWSIGIDLGGTNLKAVAIAADGTVLERAVRAVNDRVLSVSDWIAQASTIVADFERAQGGITPAVGLCAPGLASIDGRCIAYLPGKLAGVEGLDWTRALGRKSAVPVINDAHAALRGEAWVGAARGRRHVVLLTLGTGVGGAVMADGRLLRGATGRSGHLGHFSLDVDGQPSIVGMPGALEVMLGDCTVVARTGGQFESTAALVAAHLAGDTEATAIWLRSMKVLACAVASFINIFDPEIVLIGGGMIRAGDSLLVPLRTELDRVEWRPGGHAVPISPAMLGEWAGAIGAAHEAAVQAQLRESP